MENKLTDNGVIIFRKLSKYFSELMVFEFTSQNRKKELRGSFISYIHSEMDRLDVFLFILNSLGDITAEDRLCIQNKLHEKFDDFLESLYD